MLQVKGSMQTGLSLYEVHEKNLRLARPNLVLTQTLCDVCAPNRKDVDAAVARLLGRCDPGSEGAGGGEGPADTPAAGVCDVISLEPTSLATVADTFVTIAGACGVVERGAELKRGFLDGFRQLHDACEAHTAGAPAPSVMMLEWLDPPYDGGTCARALCLSLPVSLCLSVSVSVSLRLSLSLSLSRSLALHVSACLRR